MTHTTLDDAVRRAREALAEAGARRPRALVLLATGLGTLPSHLERRLDLDLGAVPGTPHRWRNARLVAGQLGPLDTWLLEDVSTEPAEQEPEPPWTAAFPIWVAAAAGAEVCVHASAGAALPREPNGAPRPALDVGSLALVRDHLNLSGATPLRGLGESALGPLFPDLSRLHHAGLRAAALARARERGLEASEAIAACTPGPALETPAERRLYARAGADVSVQGLAAPLLAAGHAGLAALACVAVVDAGEAPARLRSLVEAAAAVQPALEDLLVALAPDVAEVTAHLAEERA